MTPRQSWFYLLRMSLSKVVSDNLIMSQSKISTFFQPLQRKRSCESAKNPANKDNVTPEKKSKIQKTDSDIKTPEKNVAESDQENCSPDSKCSLSPEQKIQVETNRNGAKMKHIKLQTEGLVTDIGASWFKALEPEFTKPYFLKLGKFVAAERQRYTIYPPSNQVFSWTQTCNISDVKVVILGQDPYHGPSQAHGLCFSVPKGVPPPPSLGNMFKELSTDIPEFAHPKHGDLTGWAKQGVLLLNAVLTVRKANANSHKDMGWEKLTDAVVLWLNKHLTGVVFILWGAYAQKKGACIDKSKHHVLKGVHPSPLSAHRGFIGCKHYSQCNKILEDQGRKPIDWTDL